MEYLVHIIYHVVGILIIRFDKQVPPQTKEKPYKLQGCDDRGREGRKSNKLGVCTDFKNDHSDLWKSLKIKSLKVPWPYWCQGVVQRCALGDKDIQDLQTCLQGKYSFSSPKAV